MMKLPAYIGRYPTSLTIDDCNRAHEAALTLNKLFDLIEDSDFLDVRDTTMDEVRGLSGSVVLRTDVLINGKALPFEVPIYHDEQHYDVLVNERLEEVLNTSNIGACLHFDPATQQVWVAFHQH